MGVGEKTMIFRRQKERAAQLLWMIHKACIVVSLCFLLYITREREIIFIYNMDRAIYKYVCGKPGKGGNVPGR